MKPLMIDDINGFVNDHITIFHEKRIKTIKDLSLSQLIKKNPYLFRAKNVLKASQLIEGTMEAFLSSSEEKCFGDFLEELAIFVAEKTANGHKSTCQGVDLEFIDNQTYYVVSIKSGTNWGNSSQHKKLVQDLKDAEKRLKQSKTVSEKIQLVLGMCYGKTKTTYTNHGYLQIVGQNFWALLSGNPELYIQIIEPVGFRAKEHNDVYLVEKAGITNKLTKAFIDTYCDEDGMINWPRLVAANSGNYDLNTAI